MVIVGESPDPENIPLYTPSILALPSGRLVAAYERGKAGRDNGQDYISILTSDDKGATWTERKTTRITHGRLFSAGKSLYMLGHAGDLCVARSDDDGLTWTDPAKITSGQFWHQTAANVWHANGNVYLAMERRLSKESKGWPVGQLAPVLLRGKVTDDLTKRKNWTFASELPFSEVIPGYKENDMPTLNYFGVPFFTQSFPEAFQLGNKRKMYPIGWLETNVVQIEDPEQYWYDPTRHTFHLFMRANTGWVGYAAMAKVVENSDGTMTTSLEQAPSGKTVLYLPLPGGHLRFHIVYDEQTKLYWLLGSQPTDSMRRVEFLPEDRDGLPNNERNRMVLHFSKNMVDWCFAGVVSLTDSQKQVRSYASMDIDGDDLVILSRSGDERSKNSHDSNLITFHRVKNFRDLVY